MENFSNNKFSKYSEGLRTSIAAFFALLLVFSASLAFAQDDAPVVPTDYVLGPEDVINVVTRDIPEASGDFLVRNDGQITFPLVGEIKVSGLTLEQLKEKLYQELSKELRDPQITINLRTARQNRIYIDGKVRNPGVYDLKPKWKLSELITAASGLSEPAERLTATIFRAGEPTRRIPMRAIYYDGKDELNILMKAGDQVSILGKPTVRVNVVGSVANPGILEIFEGEGAVEALSAAGGPLGGESAALSQAKVSRGGEDFEVNLYEAIRLGNTAVNIPLEDGDTLYIPENVARVNVTGWVVNKGTQPIPDGRPLTVMEAISNAGGLSPQAKRNGVTLFRPQDNGKIEQIPINLDSLGREKGSPNMELHNQDVLFIPQSGKANSGQINSVLGLLLFPFRFLGF